MNIEITPVHTRIIQPPKDEIWDIIEQLEVRDRDIVFITSKIIAIHQGRTRKKDEISRSDLIREESDRMLSYINDFGNFHGNLTIAHGVLIPAAGIDESNANQHYILWPEKIDEFCQEIRQYLVNKYNLKHLGVVATDSHSTPLRRGVTGMAIGLAGIEPLKDIRSTKDLFGRQLKITRINMIDPLASMAVKAMGEASECTPIVLMRGDTDVIFNDAATMESLRVKPEEDLYRPLLEVMPKI